MSKDGAGGCFGGDDGFDLAGNPKSFGFMAKNRMEIFSHHTYDLIKKKDEEIAELKKKIANYEDAKFWNEMTYDNEISKLVEALKEIRKIHPYNQTTEIIDEALKGHK